MTFQIFREAITELIGDWKTVIRIFHLENQKPMKQHLVGYSKPFDCEPRNLLPANPTNAVPRPYRSKGEPNSRRMKGFNLTPVQKQALRQHMKVLKLEKEKDRYNQG